MRERRNRAIRVVTTWRAFLRVWVTMAARMLPAWLRARPRVSAVFHLDAKRTAFAIALVIALSADDHDSEGRGCSVQCAGEQSHEERPPRGDHQSVGHHGGPDAAGLVAGVAAEQAEGGRQRDPRPVGKTAQP